MADNCDYNIGRTLKMKIGVAKDIVTKNDKIKVTQIYTNTDDKLKDVQWLKQTFNFVESYDGKNFTVELQFGINLSDYKDYWEYDLLEFPDNTYKAFIYTSNDNVVVVGNQYGLFPSYTIETSESVETPNIITITMSSISQYPSLYNKSESEYYRWVGTDEVECYGYDLYSVLKQQISRDYGITWQDVEPEVKKKGEIVEERSEECGYRILERWVDDPTLGTICINNTYKYTRMVEVEGEFICQLGNKCQKLEIETSDDNNTWVKTGEFVAGDIISANDNECSYLIGRWSDCYNSVCLVVDETLTKWEDTDDTVCEGFVRYKMVKEFVTADGISYYPSGDYQKGDIIDNYDLSCADREEWLIEGFICTGVDKYQVENLYYFDGDVKSDIIDTKYTLIERDSKDCGGGIVDTKWEFAEYMWDEEEQKMYRRERKYNQYKTGEWEPTDEYRNIEVEYSEDWVKGDYVYNSNDRTVSHTEHRWVYPNESEDSRFDAHKERTIFDEYTIEYTPVNVSSSCDAWDADEHKAYKQIYAYEYAVVKDNPSIRLRTKSSYQAVYTELADYNYNRLYFLSSYGETGVGCGTSDRWVHMYASKTKPTSCTTITNNPYLNRLNDTTIEEGAYVRMGRMLYRWYNDNGAATNSNLGGDWALYYYPMTSDKPSAPNFYSCYGYEFGVLMPQLNYIYTGNWDFSNITSLNNLFAHGTTLRYQDFIDLDFTPITTMTYLFDGCTNLRSVDFSNSVFNENVDVSGMFNGCTSLKVIYMNNCDESIISKIEAVKPSQTIIMTEYLVLEDWTQLNNVLDKTLVTKIRVDLTKVWSVSETISKNIYLGNYLDSSPSISHNSIQITQRASAAYKDRLNVSCNNSSVITHIDGDIYEYEFKTPVYLLTFDNIPTDAVYVK